MKTPLPKEKFAEKRSNIFAKTKKFAKPFLHVHLGPRSNLLSKQNNSQKFHDIVPLILQYINHEVNTTVEPLHSANAAVGMMYFICKTFGASFKYLFHGFYI